MGRRAKSTLLYVITQPNIGGAQNHVADLIQEFRGRYTIHLAVGCAGPLTRKAEAAGATVHPLPSLVREIAPHKDAVAIAELTGLLRRLRPAVVHAHSSKAGMIARLAAHRLAIPAVFTAHGWGFAPGAPFARRVLVWLAEKLVAPLTSVIICVSEYDRALARRSGIGPRTPLVTVPYGLRDTVQQAAAERHPPRVLMVARFSEQKDQPLLLRAFATMTSPETCLVFAGSGRRLARNQALARQLGIAGRVQFLGDQGEIALLLANAEVFALTTHYEGLPISVLEAMRAGLPVLASDVGGLGEAVDHGVTGYLVPRGEVAAAGVALARLLGSADLRRQMGRAGRRKFVQAFTLDRMSAQIDGIYQSVLGA